MTITTEDGKTFDKIPVTWSGYNPNTLEEQTLTGTLDLTSIANEVEQPGMPVTAQIKVKLTQKNFSGISPEAYDGVYDGKAHGITLTGVPSGATVKYGESADSCTQDSLTYTNFTNGPKIVFYKVSQFGYADASGSAWVNITKRPLTVSSITENKTYAYASGSDGKAIGVNIAGKLPTDRGTTAYAVAKTDTEKLLSEVTVDTAGNLTYKVNQVDASKVGKTAIITVTASMENYANAGYTLTISITDKKTVEIKSGNTVSVDGSNALTYGEKVSKLTLGNTVFVEAGTDDVIEAGRQYVLRGTYRNSSHHSSQGNSDSCNSTNRCRAWIQSGCCAYRFRYNRRKCDRGRWQFTCRNMELYRNEHHSDCKQQRLSGSIYT